MEKLQSHAKWKILDGITIRDEPAITHYRGIAEQLTEEELVIFDLLTKPDMQLGKAEEIQMKKVARELLEKLKKEKLVLDWKKRQTTRAAVRYTVATVLDHLPRVYTPQTYESKCEQVYQQVFESYGGMVV